MDLIQAMQAEYSRAKRLLYCWAFPLGLLVFVIAVVAAFPLPDWATNALAVAVMTIQVATFALRHTAANHQTKAEEIRRLAMLQDALGIPPSPLAVARLRAITGQLINCEPGYLAPYYESTDPAGPKRLTDITAECAFFTGENARWLWNRLIFAAAAGLFTFILALILITLFSVSTTALQVAAKIVIASMAFCAAGDIATMAFQFKSLADACDKIVADAEGALLRPHALNADSETQSALIIFAEYNCAVVQAPPIPASVYRRRQRTLNDAWRSRHGTTTAAATPSPQASPSAQE